MALNAIYFHVTTWEAKHGSRIVSPGWLKPSDNFYLCAVCLFSLILSNGTINQNQKARQRCYSSLATTYFVRLYLGHHNMPLWDALLCLSTYQGRDYNWSHFIKGVLWVFQAQCSVWADKSGRRTGASKPASLAICEFLQSRGWLCKKKTCSLLLLQEAAVIVYICIMLYFII